MDNILVPWVHAHDLIVIRLLLVLPVVKEYKNAYK